MSNIVLNTKTYAGPQFANNVSNWTERSAGILSGFSKLRGSISTDSKVRVKWDFDLPVIAAVDSSCSCAGDVLRMADINLTVRMDPSMTLAERTDLADRIKDLVATSQFRDSLISLVLQTA